MNNSLKKFGRRKAGSYGKPGSKALKRAANKAVRKVLMNTDEHTRAEEDIQQALIGRRR